MADLLLALAANPNARKVITGLGLPLPLPATLARGRGPWEERPLADRDVVVWSPVGSPAHAAIAQALAEAGADPWLVGDAGSEAYRAAGEAWGRPPRLAADGAPRRPWALLVDATAFASPDDLKTLFEVFGPRVKSLARSGRLVVVGRAPEDAPDPAVAATWRALEGFVKSAGREVGRGGATANLLLVEDGAFGRLTSVLRFVLSARSTYLSGQPLRVSKRVKAAPPRWTRPLEGRVALVTGAARGIGEAIAVRLSEEGAHVVVLDRPDDAAVGAAVAARVGGTFLGIDVTAADAPARVAAHLEAAHGRVDVIVHNAGVTRDRTLAKLSPEAWDLAIAVNTTAVIRLQEALSPLLAKDGRVVCLSSIAGLAGNVGQTNYAASKAAIVGYVAAAGPKLARRGVAINAVAPGFIETRLTDAIPVATREVARRLCNLGQGGLPVDIAEMVTFLASPGADALCGQTVRVCGGSFVGA